MTVIEGTDTVQDMIFKMSQGNPGAIRVLVDLMKSGPAIDPDAMMSEIAHILSLDTLGIMGSEIWMLYKDVCGESYARMIAVLRSWQLGFTTDTKILAAIRQTGDPLDVDDLHRQVCERLEDFAKPELEETN